MRAHVEIAVEAKGQDLRFAGRTLTANLTVNVDPIEGVDTYMLPEMVSALRALADEVESRLGRTVRGEAFVTQPPIAAPRWGM